MTAQLIPTGTDPFSSQRVRLDGRDYLLRLRWASRVAGWKLDLLTDEEEPILLGVLVTVARDLLGAVRYKPACPPGVLIALPLGPDLARPGILELGEDRRVELSYYPAEV